MLQLPDPSTGEDRPYLVQDGSLFELQCTHHEFSAFLVDSDVVGEPHLYTSTKVDPLFWLLRPKALSETPWQPLDQLLQDLCDPRVVPYLKNPDHILATTEMDEVYYKCSMDKALAWLTKKYSRVEAVLRQQAKLAHRSADESAMSNNFCPADEALPTDGTPVTIDEQRVRDESLQVVCSYLCPEWQARFLEHMNTDRSVLSPKKKKARISGASTEDWNASLTSLATGQGCQAPPDTKKDQPQTQGIKKLAKVNTKGMKKLGSFFTKKENKKN